MNTIFSKLLTLWVFLMYPNVPSQQRWFIRFRYCGAFRQLRYIFKDYIIRKPYKVIKFEGEFQQELLHAIPFAYWHYRNGTLLKTISSRYTKDLYFFSKNHEEDTTITRSHFGNEDLEIPNAPHDIKLSTLKWERVPFSDHFRNNLVGFPKELLIVANRYNTEWGKSPISYFDIEDLDYLFCFLKGRYQIIYNRPPSSRISNDGSEVLELNECEWIKINHSDVIILSDLEPNLGKINSYNHLQLLVYAHCRKFISIHGGTATLASMFGGVNYIYSREGHEHQLLEFDNVFPKLSGCQIKVFKEKKELFDGLKYLIY